jgi:hypothetical protein
MVGGMAQYCGYTEADWAAIKERERSREWSAEDEQRRSEQERSRFSHAEVAIREHGVDFLTNDGSGKVFESCSFHDNPPRGPMSGVMPLVLASEAISGRRIPVLADGYTMTQNPDGTVTLVGRLIAYQHTSYKPHIIQSGVTY